MKFRLLSLFLFISLALFSKNNTTLIHNLLKSECNSADIVLFENLKQYTLNNTEIQNLLPIINQNTITTRSNDYEVAKINFKNGITLILEVVIYFSPSSDIYFSHYQYNGQYYNSRIDAQTYTAISQNKFN